MKKLTALFKKLLPSKPFRDWPVTRILAGQGLAGELFYVVLDFIPGLRIHEVFRAVLRKHPDAKSFAEVMKLVNTKLEPSRTLVGLLGTVIFWYLFATGRLSPELFDRLTDTLWRIILEVGVAPAGLFLLGLIIHGDRVKVLPFFRPADQPEPIIIGQGPAPDRYVVVSGEVRCEDVIGQVYEASDHVAYPRGQSDVYRNTAYLTENERTAENPSGRFEKVENEEL